MPGEEGANRLTGWGRFLCNLEAEANYLQILDDLQLDLAKEKATLKCTTQTPWGCHNIHVEVNSKVSCIWCKNCGLKKKEKSTPTLSPHQRAMIPQPLPNIRCTAGKKNKHELVHLLSRTAGQCPCETGNNSLLVVSQPVAHGLSGRCLPLVSKTGTTTLRCKIPFYNNSPSKAGFCKTFQASIVQTT